MKMARLLLLASALFAACSAASTQDTPVTKVIQMLSQMKIKGESQMNEEQKTFATYKEWVSDTVTEQEQEIEWASMQIEELVAFIEKADVKVAKLGDSINVLNSEIEQFESQKAEATKVREAEKDEYEKVSTDFSESVDALEKAIQILKSQNFDRSQAMLQLQKMAKSTPGMRRVLAVFLQMEEESGAKKSLRQPGAPEVAAYEFQSSSIIEMLDGLHKKFKDQLDEANSNEVNQAHYYDLLMLNLKDNIKHSTAEREDMVVTKSETAAASAEAKGKLSDTRKGKAEDEKYLADVKATFEAKSSTFAGNQEVRKAELEAIGKAIEIISSPNVAAGYAENIKLTQVASKGKATAFMQMRSTKRRVNSRDRAVEYLHKQALRLNSNTLEVFAQQIAGNPFGKVIKMIEDLLAKLKEEAGAEAEHKAWCDEQLKANKLKRNKQSEIVDKLASQIDETTSKIATMGKDIEKLMNEQRDLSKAMKEATEIRGKEKADNLDTIADAKAGSKAVQSALTVLKEFYDSQAGFVQMRKQVPEMAAYKGMQGAKGGVVGMLEVIASDFLRLEAETSASEKQAAQEYDTFMSDSTASKEIKHKEEVKLKLDKDKEEFKKSDLEKDLKFNTEELNAATEYFEYLKPQCLTVKVSFEERAAKREEELAALKEAYQILDAKR